MNAVALLLTLPAAGLIAAAAVPSRIATPAVKRYRQVVSLIAGLQFVIAVTMAAGLAWGLVPSGHAGLMDSIFGSSSSSLAPAVYFDGVSSLMLALVSFVGWVICRYSIRYLDGEQEQSRYFRWAGFTIAAVSLMVISGNLLMFVVCWISTSLGLHRLLLHYGDRPAARRAAWTKFTISRVGDTALIGAVALLYSHYGTLQLAELFSAIDSRNGSPATAVTIASVLLVLAAIAKSAQFPFHTWLPQTMETPTPVSALMHAGIVNAGGYLIIRFSPVVVQTPLLLSLLAIVGAVTAVFAAVVMLTQTSVKKSLAYSTIAQMGFMMLQCGLGAFSAAMLHILAHSLYKAHAFLSSGSVVAQQRGMATWLSEQRPVSVPKLAIAGTTIVAFLSAALLAFGVDVVAKPGGLLLGGILCLALTQWVGQVMRAGNQRLLIRSLATSGVLCFAYVFCFVVVDNIIAGDVPAVAGPGLAAWVAASIAAGFIGMFLFQSLLGNEKAASRMRPLYVHVSNGFYVESYVRSLFSSLRSA